MSQKAAGRMRELLIKPEVSITVERVVEKWGCEDARVEALFNDPEFLQEMGMACGQMLITAVDDVFRRRLVDA